MTNRYSAGQPCTPQMPVDFAGEEPTTSTLEHDYETYRPEPIKQKDLVSLRDRFLSIFKKPWGVS
jgi:hypothetical protein